MVPSLGCELFKRSTNNFTLAIKFNAIGNKAADGDESGLSDLYLLQLVFFQSSNNGSM